MELASKQYWDTGTEHVLKHQKALPAVFKHLKICVKPVHNLMGDTQRAGGGYTGN